MDLNKKIEDISQAEYKLLLIIGQPGSGKSKIIRQYSEDTGIPILDLDKILDVLDIRDIFLEVSSKNDGASRVKKIN